MDASVPVPAGNVTYNMAGVLVTDATLDWEAEAEDVPGQSLALAHSQPHDWKNEARDSLVHIFRAAVQRSSPNLDLGSLTPAIREVISRALAGVEERVLHYAKHVTRLANEKRAGVR